MNSQASTASRGEMDVVVDRGFLDSFVEALPTTSDFQALFYNTGAKFSADLIAEPQHDPNPTPPPTLIQEPHHHSNVPSAATVITHSLASQHGTVPVTLPLPPVHSFTLPFHPHPPGQSFAYLTRPSTLSNLEQEFIRPSAAMQQFESTSSLAASDAPSESVISRANSMMKISSSTASLQNLPQSTNSSEQPIPHPPKPQKNLSAAAKERRRERNKVLARKTRQKKKFETESLRDRLIALMVENEKLKHTVKNHLPDAVVNNILNQNSALPDNIQTLVQQMLVANQRALWGEITSKQRAFCISNPHLPDCPIVFVSPGFLELTGYSKEDCIGKNCRFLQGPATDRTEVQKIKDALLQRQDITVVLLNYTKKGDSFWNKIEISHLCDENQTVRFVVGVQNKCDAQYIRTRLARHRSMSALSFGDESSETTRNTLEKTYSSTDLYGQNPLSMDSSTEGAEAIINLKMGSSSSSRRREGSAKSSDSQDFTTTTENSSSVDSPANSKKTMNKGSFSNSNLKSSTKESPDPQAETTDRSESGDA